MRPGKSNVVGVLMQDWIQKSRNATAMLDANASLMAVDREAAFNRVISDHEESFGASNVIPAGTPLKAAEGWDEENDDEQMVVQITHRLIVNIKQTPERGKCRERKISEANNG